MRRGERMTCHPTDPRMVEWPGYEGTGNSREVRECAGALILQQREFEVCQSDYKANVAQYRRERSMGLTKDGLRAILHRALFGATPLGGGLPMASVNLNDPDTYHEPLGEWEPR
jgi:hypothetical protein